MISMKKVSLLIIVLMVCVSIIGVMFFLNNTTFQLTGKCQIERTMETPVSLNLAKTVGEDYIQRYYPESDWVYVGNYPVYNSLGNINYYLLIFRESEFMTLNTLEKLEQNAQLFSDSSQDESDKKYQFNNIANIMTSSMKEDKLIQNHRRGIPESMGEKLEIKEFIEDQYSTKTIGNLISDSSSGLFYYEIIERNSKKSSGNAIRVYDFSIVSISDLIKIQKDIQKRKDSKYSTYGMDECQKFQSAISEAGKAQISEWNKYE